MTWKSYALVSGAGVISMWFAAALPSRMPSNVPPEQPPAASRAAIAASEIVEQADRLQERLRQESLYRAAGRNLFRFAPTPVARPVTPVDVARPPLPLTEVPAGPPPLPMKLAGIAADQSDSGIVRTAILSTFSGVVLARPGDEVLDRFRVTDVHEDAVDFVTIADGTPVT